MDNKEDILDALNEFEKKPSPEIPVVLEQYLRHVAKTGKTLFPWQKLKKLFVTKVDTVMTRFMEASPTDLNVESVKCEELRERVLTLMDEFQGAPFTVQRICELILEPRRHYKRCDKFLRGMEKNMSVVTSVDPFGRKIISESQALVNGLDSNGFNEGLSKPNPFSSFPTPTQSAWTANIDKWFGTSDQSKATSSSYDNTTLPSDEEEEEEDGEEEKLTEQLLTETSEEYGASSSINEHEPSTSGIANKDETDNSVSISSDQQQNGAERLNVSEERPVTTTTPITNTTQDEEDTSTDSEPQENVTEFSVDNCPSEKPESEVYSNNTQSDQTLDICEKAQNILESVNKACSEAEKTVSIAKKVIETDQQVQSEDTSSEKDNDQRVSQTSEVSQVMPDVDQTQQCKEIDSQSNDNVKQAEDSDSTGSEHIKVCSKELPAGDGSGDTGVSNAKKPRLSDNCESMDVDSSEFSDSSNNAGNECQTESVTENEKQEQARLEGIAEVKGQDKDTPMEQD